MMNVGAVIINPDFFGPWVFAAGFVVKENYIGFNALSIEYPGGQAKDGVVNIWPSIPYSLPNSRSMIL